MKILTVVGARPQFIKAAVVSRAIMEHNQFLVDGFLSLDTDQQRQLETKNQKLITELIVHTGQHFDTNMSDIFFDEMQIPRPDYNLAINGLGHGAMTGQMLEKIEEVLLNETPDWVLVYGDTNSTLAGALAAVKLHIPVAHVEAGLRSFNRKMPEEINRILTDQISNILFCPTKTAVQNLKNEGFDQQPSTINHQLVLNVGDVMQDAALFYKDLAKKPDFTKNQKLKTSDYVLCTLHRAENTDDPHRLRSIFAALDEIAEEKTIILPLHPRTRQKLETINYQPKTKNLLFIDPVGYLEMIWLLEHCSLVLTDSGGVQKEAFFFGKACVTMRDQTEWVELIDAGVNELVGADREKIVAAVSCNFGRKVDDSNCLYGGGKAAEKIVEYLVKDSIDGQ